MSPAVARDPSLFGLLIVARLYECGAKRDEGGGMVRVILGERPENSQGPVRISLSLLQQCRIVVGADLVLFVPKA
jgi:hypothetical protein